MKAIFSLIIGISLLNTTQGQTDTKPTFSIGDHYGGGIIFSLDETKQHGLIAAPNDQTHRAYWGKSGWSNANYMNEGDLNAVKIYAFRKANPWTFWDVSQKGKQASRICDTLNLAGFDDWYLPAINELREMYEKQMGIGNFIAGDYCSSTESSQNDCWNVHFKPIRKVVFHYKKSFDKYCVRCIRKF